MLSLKDWILIVEDEDSISEGLKFNFEKAGYKVTVISDGMEALEFLKSNHTKLSVIILDLMLPSLDGYEILKSVRQFAKCLPILVLSARSLEVDRIQAFENGADDYVIKPFSLAELLLRIKNLVQRGNFYRNESKKAHEKIVFGEGYFYPKSLHIEDSLGEKHKLSPTEGLLCQTFLSHPSHALSRSQLLKFVWNYEVTVETRTVDVFVGKIRKYIEKNPAHPKHLISVRGIGYQYNNSK